MPLHATSGAASYDAFGGGAAAVTNYIEDVFSTYLTTGASANITVVNGIDLSGKGGLVWQKTRTSVGANTLFDTVRGVNNYLFSNATNAQGSASNILPTFNNNGFVIGTDNNLTTSGENGVSWTFRKQPKFFDVVTYTGDGNAGLQINHALGSVPGCIIVKNTSNSGNNWCVYHRGFNGGVNPEQYFAFLNTTAAQAAATVLWNDTAPTSTNFTVGTASGVNSAGNTYVAYLFAHDAGGFGLTGTDNVISCGSFTTTAGGAYSEVSLGYEPQWVLIKTTSTTNDWMLFDNMRGMTASLGGGALLTPNSSAQEFGGYSRVIPTATGFYGASGLNASANYIYIAIRRGPMKVPTSGSSVFSPATSFSSGAATTNFPVDSMWAHRRTTSNSAQTAIAARLTGEVNLVASSTLAEGPDTDIDFASNTQSIWAGFFANGLRYSFQRAPSFFDVVCYTGTGANRTVAHNLTVAPELIIVKNRSVSDWNWAVYSSTLGGTKGLATDLDIAEFTTSNWWTDTNPTSSVFTVGTGANTNASGNNIVAYLFATCAGVSKVGSYTGTATTKQVDCGFTGGARFVLIKRTDSTGDWYVWDSARGIVSGNDPYLLLNSSAAEVTNTDYVDTYSAGFEISSTAPAAINASGGTFVFLAIA